MSKIRVIDLLNKIANGEDVPKKIKIKDSFYVWGERNKIKGYLAQDSDNDYAEWIDDRISVDCKEDLTTMVEIIEEELEIDIQGIEPLNAYKLMEAPFMADKLKEMNYDTFMEHLKQSEVEIANKIIELIRVVKQLDKQINNK